MSAAKREIAGAQAGNGDAAALSAAGWLSLAATPSFAIMALLTGIFGGPPDMLCSTAHDESPLAGMAECT